MEDVDHTSLRDKIRNEMKLVAQAHLLDAWEAGLQDGIEPEILARTIIEKALEELAELRGLFSAETLATEILKDVDQGAYLSDRVLQ